MVASSSSSSWMLALKVLLFSAGVVSVAVTAKLAAPLIFNFALNDLPAIWSVVVSWLEPPYLYIIMNGIIIAIVACTHFLPDHHQENRSQQQFNYNPSNTLPPADLRSNLPPVSVHWRFGVTEPPPVTYDLKPDAMVEPPVVYESKRADVDVETVAVGGPVRPDGVGRDEDDFNATRSTWNQPINVRPEFDFPVKEKLLVTSRFAHNRKPSKIIPEGAKALRVLKPKKHETLDSTWKMITDGRQFRKSDTFDNLHHDRPSDESTASANSKLVRTSETFKDRTTFENQNHNRQPSSTNISPAAVGELNKDLSPSHDELNRRVEAFIKKFNDDMRLQRQESLDQYLEMVDRGAR